MGSVQVAAAAVASADRIIEDEVRELVRRRGPDPLHEPDAIRRVVDEVINDYGAVVDRCAAGAGGSGRGRSEPDRPREITNVAE